MKIKVHNYLIDYYKRLNDRTFHAPGLYKFPKGTTALAEEATALPSCAGVLCLDEVQVTDIADASIVRGLVDPTPTPTPIFCPHPLPPTPIPLTRWTTS